MKLMTKEIEKQLPSLYSQEEVKDPICKLKYFLGGWTWYVLEAEKQENDWLFFGKVVSPFEPDGELGYFSLRELEEVRGPFNLKVERDLYWTPKPLSECK